HLDGAAMARGGGHQHHGIVSEARQSHCASSCAPFSNRIESIRLGMWSREGGLSRLFLHERVQLMRLMTATSPPSDRRNSVSCATADGSFCNCCGVRPMKCLISRMKWDWS